jgi:hypothetical protein
MTTKAEITQMIAVLGVLYPRNALAGEELKRAVSAWHELLSDVPIHLLRKAVSHHGATSKWFPTVAELREIAFDLCENDAERMSSGEAWAEVRRAMSSGRRQEWSSPLVKKALAAIGGWAYLREATLASEVSNRSRFCDAFETIQARERRESRLLPVVKEQRARIHELTGPAPAAVPQLGGEEGKRMAAGQTGGQADGEALAPNGALAADGEQAPDLAAPEVAGRADAPDPTAPEVAGRAHARDLTAPEVAGRADAPDLTAPEVAGRAQVAELAVQQLDDLTAWLSGDRKARKAARKERVLENGDRVTA